MIGHFHECIREPDPLWEVILQPQYLRNLLTLDQSLDRDRVMLRPRLRYLILFLSLGLVASYVSVNVLTSYGYLPSGIAIMNYGFPLPWETVSGTLCTQSPPQPLESYPVLIGSCLKSCCVTTYNLAFLLFDVLFYMAIGYLYFSAIAK